MVDSIFGSVLHHLSAVIGLCILSGDSIPIDNRAAVP